MKKNTAIIIPCYKVGKLVIQVIEKALKYSNLIVVVDDCSPNGERELVENYFLDNQDVKVIKLDKNVGVGGATLEGFKYAIKEEKIEYILKIDGDDQMDQSFIPEIIDQLQKKYDYVKGNRFKEYSYFCKMPKVRIVGNVLYSFLAKLSSGYYNISDAHNGFIAIRKKICKAILKNNVSKRYFFEVDLLYHLKNLNAKVYEIYMPAIYQDEKSNLNYISAILVFPFYHLKNFLSRVLLHYFLRDFNFASICFLFGMPLFFYSIFFLISEHLQFSSKNIETPAGTAMFGALMFFTSFQLIMLFFYIDYSKDRELNK